MAERRHEHDCGQHCLSHTCEPGCDAAFQSELGSDLADQDHLSAEHVRAVPRLDIKQLHDTLRALPPRFARSYLNGRPPSMDAAKRAHERLYRSPEHNRHRELLMLASPVTALVRAPRGLGLDARACAALLTGHDSAHTTAETHPRSAVALSDTAHLPDAMRLAALAANLVSCRPAPPMAVALLLADPAVPPEVAEALASFWAAMRERTSALPAAPASLPDLAEAGKIAMKRIGTTPPQHESADTSRPATSTPHGDTTATMTDPAPATHSEGRADSTDSAPDIDELTNALARLRSAFAEATDSARGIHDTLTRGCRPEQASLDRIGALAEDMDRLGHELRAVTGAETPAASLDELETELGRAREHREHAGIRSRFAALEGPKDVAPALTEIREAANSADRDENVTEQLRLLAELVDRTAQDPYDSACAELLQRVMAQTPDSWHPAVMAAMHGQLTLGATAPHSAEPAESAADAKLPAASPAPEPTPKDPPTVGTPSEDTLADLDAALARETGQDTNTDTNTETPAPPEEPTPAPSAESADHTDSQPQTTTETTPHPPAEPEPANSAASTEPSATPPQEAEASTAVPPQDSAPAATPTEAPAPAPSPSVPSAPAVTDPRSEIVGKLERTAMEQHRFGLAAWLKRAAEAPENAATTRYAAACAEKIQDSTGPMAEAFRERAQLLCDDLPTEPADRLLAWAAATRAVLVAPTLEATQLIEQTSVVTSGRPGLNGIGDAVRNAVQSGIYISLPEGGEHLRDADHAQHDRDAAATEAARLRQNARKRTINYQAATEIWRRMVSPDGDLWPLLDIPAADDTNRLQECHNTVAHLRDPGAVDALIDRSHQKSKSGPRKSRGKIIANARNALRKNIEQVRDTAHAWVIAVQRVNTLRDPRSAPDYTTRGLSKLHQTVTGLRDQAEQELAALSGDGGQLMGVAAHGVRLLLDQVDDLLRGHFRNEAEPSVGMTLHHDLLLVPRIPFSPAGEPTEAPTLDELADVLATDPDWPAACHARIAADDFVGADLIAALIRNDDPATADRLTERAAEHLEAARRRLQQESDAVRADVALRWRNGALSEEEANRLMEAAAALAADQDRRDFGAMAAELADLRAQSDQLRDRRIADRKAEVGREAESSDRVARYADRLRGYLDADQVTSSDELLAQLKANREIVERTEETDHFAQFFPTFPDVLERTGGRARGRNANVHPVIPELVTQLTRDPQAPAPQPDTPEHSELLADLLESQGSGGGRGTAAEALRQWRTVAQGAKSSGNLAGAVEKILRLLGVEARMPDEAAQPQRRNRMLRVNLPGVGLTGDALLPAFGSKMSTSGDQLTLCLIWNRPEPSELFEWLRDTPHDHTVLMLYFGLLTRTQRQELTELARSRRGPVIGVVDDAAMAYLGALARPQWSTTVRLVAPFTATRPFQAERMIPEEMFYGREEDLDAVMAPSGAHFVYGGRQLGKSVLLAEAERRLRAQDDGAVVIQRDVYEIGRSQRQIDHFWTVLGGTLSERGIVSAATTTPATKEEVCEALRAWARSHPDKRLLLFFDEADEFLNLDAEEHSFANVVALRELMADTDNRVKAVFAGLHKIARFRSYPNQPFANLGEPLGIGPLSSPDAYDLLTQPLRTLGFHIPEELAVNVIAQANNAPALVQYFGDLLLRRLQKAKPVTLPHEVTLEDVNAVRSDPEIDKAFRDRFEWTLDLDKRYKVIAYVVALQTMDARDTTVDEKELRNECRDWWPGAFEKCATDEFGALLEECVDLGVLAEADGDFRLRTPHILTLLGGRSRVERELQGAEATYQLPDSFDAASYRPKYREDGSELSPLTAAQTARLGNADGRIRIVAGSAALQVERVPSVLKSAAQNVRRVGIHGEALEGALQRARGRRKDIVLVELSDDTATAAGQIEAANRVATEAPEQQPNVVLVAGPGHAPLLSAALDYPYTGPAAEALERADIVELRRFGRSGVRQWRLLDNFARIADESVHDRLFEVTGGWPSLVNTVVREVVDEGSSPEDSLQLRTQALENNPDAFVRSTGITNHSAVRAAWDTIVEYGSTEHHDDLSLVLETAAEQDPDGPLGTGSEIDHSGLVGVLRGLGALVPQDNGALTPEEVLLRTYRTSSYAQNSHGDHR